MANAKVVLNHQPANTTEFRNLGLLTSNALASVGLVKTSDTGTIDWSTVNIPGASTIAGYEIWRFNDTHQSTTPIFIKLGYGVYNPNSHMWMTVSIGTGTNGSLGLLNATATFNLAYAGSSNHNDGSAKTTAISSDGSGLYFSHIIDGGPPSNSYPARGRIVVDRYRNLDGSASPNGVMILHTSNNSGVTAYSWDRVNNILYSNSPQSLMPYPAPYNTSTRQNNGSVPLGLFYTLVPDVGIYRSKMVVTVPAADFGAFAQIQATHLGATRTFMAHGVYDPYWDAAAQATVSNAQWWSD